MKKSKMLSFIAVLFAAIFVFTACDLLFKGEKEWKIFQKNTEEALESDAGYSFTLLRSAEFKEGNKVSFELEFSMKNGIMKVMILGEDYIKMRYEMLEDIEDISKYDITEFYMDYTDAKDSVIKLIIKYDGIWIEIIGTGEELFLHPERSIFQQCLALFFELRMFPEFMLHADYKDIQLKDNAYQYKPSRGSNNMLKDEYMKFYMADEKLSKIELKQRTDIDGEYFGTTSVSIKYGIDNINVPEVSQELTNND